MAGQGAPKTPKQELLEAIEAYGTSKGTDDKLLQRLAMVNLAQLLKKYDVVAPVPAPQAAAIQAKLPELPEKKPVAKKAPAKKPAARKPRTTKKKTEE
jgi:hypothetical protein